MLLLLLLLVADNPLRQVVTFVSLVLFTRQGLEPTLKWLYKRWCAAQSFWHAPHCATLTLLAAAA
jgi:hypothetical protein